MPWIWPDLSETIFVSAPASSSACLGFVISTCSKPSVTRMATFFPSNFRAISPPFEFAFDCQQRHRRGTSLYSTTQIAALDGRAQFPGKPTERHMNQCRSEGETSRVYPFLQR